MKVLLHTLLRIFLATTVAMAADNPTPSQPTKLADAIIKFHELNLEKYKGSEDILLIPGLVADRKQNRVTFLAETTRVHEGDISEFFVIAPNSGHDYEALAVSAVKAADINKALTFIGMEPGLPFNEGKLRFWPKGERALMSFTLAGTTNAASTRVEKFIVDDRTGQTLPVTGMVYVGSSFVDVPGEPGAKAYAPDIKAPNSIASDYNEPGTMFDLPWRAPQSAVYEHFCVGPAFNIPSNSIIEVSIDPEYKDGRKRVADISLSITAPTGTPQSVTNLLYTMKLGTETLVNAGPLKDVLEKVISLVESGRDAFTLLHFDSSLNLAVMHDLCEIFSAADTDRGMRIEPPAPGQLYYCAFNPDEAFRVRESRITQPWEIHLSLNEGKVTGLLTQIDQVWKDDAIRPDLKIAEAPVATPAALKEELEKRGPGIPIILVFAAPAITHGQLMEFVGPLIATYPTIHIFTDKNP